MGYYYDPNIGEYVDDGLVDPEPTPDSQISPYDTNSAADQAWQQTYKAWINAGATGMPPERPITNPQHPQYPATLAAQQQAAIDAANNSGLGSYYDLTGTNANAPVTTTPSTGATTTGGYGGTGTDVVLGTGGGANNNIFSNPNLGVSSDLLANWERATKGYVPKTPEEANLIKAIQSYSSLADYAAANNNGTFNSRLQMITGNLPGYTSPGNGTGSILSGMTGNTGTTTTGGTATTTTGGTATTGTGTTTTPPATTGTGTNTNMSNALRNGAPDWMKSFLNDHQDLLNNWNNAISNPNDPAASAIKGYGSLENYLTQAARAYGTDAQKTAANSYNPTTGAPSPTNPATGKQWTYSELMNRYIVENNGKTPSGAEFNQWAGSVLGDGVDWTNTNWTPDEAASNAMSTAAGGAGGAGGMGGAGGAGGSAMGGAGGSAMGGAGGSVGNLSSAGGAGGSVGNLSSSGGSVGNISINTGTQYQPIELKDAQGNPIRNLVGEGASTLAAQVALAPQIFEQYKQFAPQYAQQDVLNLGRSLYGPQWSGTLDELNRQMTESAATQTNRGNQIAREAAMADINTFGGQTAEAMMNLNPALWRNLDAMDAQARAGVAPSQYQQSLGNTFNNWSANPTITPQQVTGPQITQNQLGAGPQLSATGVSAQQVTPGVAQTNLFAAPQGISSQNVAADKLGGPMLVQNQGISAPAVQAQMLNNPYLVQEQQNPLLALASQQAATQGASPLEQDLQAQARQQLALGGGLSDEQRRNAQQAAREAWGARGLINSAGAVGSEVLGRDAYSQQLQNQRQQFAQNVAQLGQAQQGMGNQYTLGVLGAAGQQAGLGQQAQLANQAAFQDVARLNQSTGMQAQLANQDASMRAQQANQATGLQAQQLNQQALLQTGQLNQATGLQAGLANQQAGLTAAQANLQAQLQAAQANQQNQYNTQALNLQTGLEAQRANQAAGLQAGQLNQQNIFAVGQANQQDALARAAANQQNAYQTQIANQGTAFGASQANQQAGLQAQQAQEALRLQALGQRMGLGQSLAGLDYANQQQGFSNLAQASQMRTANQIDPFRILSIGTANQGTNQALFGQGSGASSGALGNQGVLQQFNPYNAYSSDLFNTNFNAGESRYLNAQNNAANLAAAQASNTQKSQGATMGLIGSLGSAAIMAF